MVPWFVKRHLNKTFERNARHSENISEDNPVPPKFSSKSNKKNPEKGKEGEYIDFEEIK